MAARSRCKTALAAVAVRRVRRTDRSTAISASPAHVVRARTDKTEPLVELAAPHHRMHSDPPDRIESAKRTAGNSVLLQRNRPNPDIGRLPQDGWKRTFRPGRGSQY